MARGDILGRKFFERLTLEVAKDLLGCYLVRKIGKKEIRAVIIDVEAYIGQNDLASHASKGRTLRTELMYGEAGYAYVYLVYGMYNVLNIVTEKKDFPAAVMIRGVKIDGIDYTKTNGPGKVCRQLKIDRNLNGLDVASGEKLWIEKGKEIPADGIVTGTRIGVAYAGHSAQYPWRFTLKIF